jgi:hypothetical protein
LNDGSQVRRCAAALGAALGALSVAHGSTPDAWKAYEKEVTDACVAASHLNRARPGGQRVDFDDAVGYSVLVIIGRYPQSHMKNRPGRELCLFDKRTRRATVTDADKLI